MHYSFCFNCRYFTTTNDHYDNFFATKASAIIFIIIIIAKLATVTTKPANGAVTIVIEEVFAVVCRAVAV